MVLEAGDLLASKIVAEADVESNEAGLLKLESGARSRTLFASNAISKAELEQKEAAAHAAAAEVGRASASTAEASAAFQLVKTGSRSEDIRIAKASLAAARGRLDAIINQIGELTIRAARPSRVESITVRPGDILGANAPAVTVLEDGQLYVRIYVPETQIGKVAVGQNVPITVDSFPGRTFAGKVAHINEVGEYTPRAMTTSDDRADEVFGLRIALIDGQRELRAGMVTFIHVAKR